LKKTIITAFLILNLISFSNLFAQDSRNSPDVDRIFVLKLDSHVEAESVAAFNFGIDKHMVFSFNSKIRSEQNKENKKKYFKAAVEITSFSLAIWIFNRYVTNAKWAYISPDTWWTNIKSGLSWDRGPIWVNQLGHPFHGAIHYSIARSNNLNVLESSLFAVLASLQWEFFLESPIEQLNYPSRNDLIMNTLGSLTLGEILFRTSNFIIDESSVGFERVIREFLAFVVNPGNFFRVTSGDAFKVGNPPEKHYFSLKIPFGVYTTTSGKPAVMIALNLECEDHLKNDLFSLSPYEYFTINIKVGYQGRGFRDKEILTAGVFAGRKIKNGIAGLFGTFGYVDTLTLDRLATIGFGPGLVKTAEFDKDMYFRSSGILSLILGGASPSIDSPKVHFGTKVNAPYYFGPGLLGRVKLELGKLGLGSIEAGVSQCWIHSIYTGINEFRSILSLNLNCDITNKSQIRIGFGYYLRYASLQSERFKNSMHTFSALYILRF
jgi:hypothetical protein